MAQERNMITENCIYGARKPCSCACPVNFDVEGFIRRLRTGNLKSAQRMLAVGLVFPDLVCELCDGPCAKACAYGIDLRRMERSCNALQASVGPARYTLPKQNKTVAIIGAGISGLACAQKLAARNYDVTLFERGSGIGGTLIELLGKKRCEAEFRRQFAHAPYTLRSDTSVETLEELAGFDAVYIATGKAGHDFGLVDSWNSQSKATGQTGVFLGGELVSAGKMAALSDGIVASASIEYYLRSGRMDGEQSKFLETQCRLPTQEGTAEQRDELMSKEELIEAAKRCRLCDCDFCTEGCEFLKWFALGPKKLEESMKNAQAATSGYVQRQGTRTAYSCSLCGRCKNVCPEGIGFDELMLETKQKLFQNGKFPEVLHDYFTQDMLTAQTRELLVRPAPGHEKAAYMLFPGCQEVKTAPEHVKSAYAYLLERFPDTALALGCCGVPALWAGNEGLFSDMLDILRGEWERLGRPTAVLMCPSCAKTFRRYLPEIPFLTLYELIDRHGLPPGARCAGDEELAIFDPCASAGFPEMQRAVRSLLSRLGGRICELPESGEKASCCGMGGHIYPTNRALAQRMLRRAAEQSPLEYVCYCANCRSLFVLEGKPCRHILDDVFGLPPVRQPLHLAQMEDNRNILKQEVLKQYWNETWEPPRLSAKTVAEEKVRLKMDAALISEHKVQELIALCEADQKRFLVPERGTYIGHRQIGRVTYWVEYAPEGGDTYRIFNAYSHKISIHD